MLGPFAFQYFFIIFCLAWIEEFGFICLKYSKTAIMSHTKKCLYLYKSLQSGLGRDNTTTIKFLQWKLYFRNIFCCNIFCPPAINHNFSFLDNFVSLSNWNAHTLSEDPQFHLFCHHVCVLHLSPLLYYNDSWEVSQ